MNLATWVWSVVAIAIAMGLVTVVHWLLHNQLARVWSLAVPIRERCRYSAYAAAAVVAVNIVVPGSSVFSEHTWYTAYEHGIRIAMIVTLTWLGVSIAYALSDGILERLSVYNEDTDRKARRLRTQIRLARRVITSLIVFIATAAVLWTFPEIRALSAGLLGTAGVLSIVAGVAAQSTLGNIFAGIQLVFGDQLRMNDIVVVQGEWGRVEELTLTTVVVRIWDERRLVLPVSYFTNNAFENWTKHGATVTGKVYLRVDWQIPVRELREHTGEFIAKHPLWDGRRWSLQATDVLESGSVELRVVVTAADSDAQWDLCCDIREFLIAYVTENYPEALPHRRTTLLDAAGREVGELRALADDE